MAGAEAYNFSVIAVFVTITAAGIAGGIGGALLKDGADEDKQGTKQGISGPLKDPEFVRCIVLGILAAYVVPLFLVLAATGSPMGIMVELLGKGPDAAGKWWSNLFVLMGFCIVAALAAQNFLTSVSQRVLTAARSEARAAARAETQQMQGDLKEVKAETKAAAQSVAALQANPEGYKQKLSDESARLLRAFLLLPGSEASVDELAQGSGLPADEAQIALDDLRDRNLVESVQAATTRPAWRLTGWGQAWLRTDTQISRDEHDVLHALATASDRRPRAQALAAVTARSDADVSATLERLRKLGLVERSKTVQGGWRLRSVGRDVL